MYTDGCGYMEAVDVRQERTVLRITGFPEMDPAHCRMMEGWMIAAMDVIGARVLPGAKETACMTEGAPYHEFSCNLGTEDLTLPTRLDCRIDPRSRE